MYIRPTVSIISNNDLTKEVYEFECRNTILCYTMYHQYNRNSKKDLWPDEWPEPLSYGEWCKETNPPDVNEYDENGWDCYSEMYHDGYRKYCDGFNPCLVKTGDGRTCGSGQAGYNLSKNHPLPDGVKEKAKENFINLLKVEG